MTDRILVIDLETSDPYIDRGLGAGWVYKLNVPNSDFRVLGAAFRTHEGEVRYETEVDKIISVVRDHNILVCHNANYDLGCLLSINCEISDMVVYDTEIMSRLHNSSLFTHSLDAIAKKYLGIGKNDRVLTDAIWDNKLYPWLKKEVKEKERTEKKGEVYTRTRPDETKLVKWAKKNMGIIQDVAPEAMARYAMDDVIPTYKLFKFFSASVDMDTARKYSSCTHVCLDYRKKGIRVDLDRVREAHNQLIPIINKWHQTAYELAGEEFNLNSPKDVPRIFDNLGISYPTNKATGNPTIDKAFLLNNKHPLCKAIVEARQAVKIDNDFLLKILDMQEYTCPDAYPHGSIGRVYPEFNLLRARTGRFSCSCPNIQQIPSRHPIYSDLCRSIFIPEEGDKWFSLDFSNQEGRLQVHYANRLKCEGASELVLAFNKDANLDMHQKVADAAGIGRTEAKAINLGLSYGMGMKKLADQLSLTVGQAKILRNKYDNIAPYLTELSDKCKDVLKKRGYIKTIGGRHSTIDPSMWIEGERKTFEYKALNKLIQGSAADQSIEAMLWAYKEGIPVLFPVHDQLCMSGNAEQAKRLAYIMENAVQLDIPCVVDYDKEGGSNWASAGH